MITRFQTRTFLLCFVPFSLLLAAAFWMVHRFVPTTVRDGLHSSLRDSQEAIATIHAKVDLQNSHSLRAVSDNADLRAAILQLVSDPKDATWRSAVEDRLRELGEQARFDFMLVSLPDGSPLVGVVRSPGDEQDARGKLKVLDTTQLYHSDSDIRIAGGRTLQTASVAISQDRANIALLSAGKDFGISDLTTPVVLVHDGKVIDSSIPQIPFDEIARALVHCTDHSECDVTLRGANWISLPLQTYGGGYALLSFENVDRAAAPVQSKLNDLFVTVLVVLMLIAFLCSIASSNNIVKPIAAVVSHLRSAAGTGVLSELEGQSSSILEIRELADFYNRAAVSVRAAHDELSVANLEFVGSLASALDARDEYTAGHSWRVSQLSCAIAAALQLEPSSIERIRIGALLHDIGKIGIADTILQKRGRLTKKEDAIVRKHPVIGRHILEGVQGFAPFLAAVEQHHENWDGSGYPHGQSGYQTAIDARIIHVADAYDAMTTHRPYRHSLTHEEALAELIEYAGQQFDPQIVKIFVSFQREAVAAMTCALPDKQEHCYETAV
jgi:HD-GYP domain-containing protein (c-di-GMP phosphodiesterase class II)